MAAVVLGQNFYKEYQGVDHLSKTFQSNLAFSPGDAKRRTLSQDSFTRQRDQENRIPKTPWGRKYSYGGIGPVCLPDDHRPKTEPPLVVQKGHRHLSSGACIHPRYVTTSEKYALTSLRRSNLRASDELIESPTKVDVTKHTIELPFPAEHPYATHIARTSMFPPYETPTTLCSPRSIDTPESPADVLLISKSRGAAYRYEKISPPEERKRRPVEWLEGPNFFQLLKGERDRQKYYPIPIKSLDPNMKSSRNISGETARALRQLRSTQWTSTYQNDVNGEKPSTPRYTNSLGDGNNVLLVEDDKTKDCIQGIPNNGNHGQDVTHATEHVQKSVQFNIEEATPNPSEMKENHNDENLETVEPSCQLETPRCLKANDRSAQASRSFISASYPPIKSKQTQLCTEGTWHENMGPEEYYDELARGWSRSDVRRQFNRTHKDQITDLRRKPDLRITTNERRHRFPEFGNAGSYVWNGLSVPYRKGIINQQ